MADDEKRNEAILRAILSPTRKLADDVQREVEPYLKTALTEPDGHERQDAPAQLWPGDAPLSEGLNED